MDAFASGHLGVITPGLSATRRLYRNGVRGEHRRCPPTGLLDRLLEHSTGGKQKLLGISKRGNSYLRRLFVQDARAVMQQHTKQSSGLSAWLADLTSRTTGTWPERP